jgi:hypothetical protein
MKILTSGDLTLEATEDGPTGPIRVAWKGRSVERTPAQSIGPYFRDVLGEASSRGAPVEIHFEQLEHFNSSTITAIVQIIQQAKGVPLTIVYDDKVEAQQVTFRGLHVLAKPGLLEFRGL